MVAGHTNQRETTVVCVISYCTSGSWFYSINLAQLHSVAEEKRLHQGTAVYLHAVRVPGV